MQRSPPSSILAAAVVLATTWPSLTRPPHIDDANFLVLARGARLDFWRPHAIDINWQGTTERAFDVLSNPPGIGWWLAPVVDAPDVIRHMWMWPWLMLACWGAATLGRRFGAPAWATILLLCANPAALLAATAWTPDLPLYACALAGFGGLWTTRRPAFAVLVGLAACFRYSGVALIPLAGLAPALQRDWRRAAYWTVLAALPTVGLFLHDLHAYGEWHIAAMSRFQSVSSGGRDVIRKLIAAVCMYGGALVLPLLATTRRALIGALVGGMLGGLGAGLSGLDGWTAGWTVVCGGAGGAALAGAARLRTHDERLLAAWLFGGLLFLLQLRFTAARYWLPFAAPGVLATLGQAGNRQVWGAVGVTVVLAMALSIDDARLARAQRDLAQQVNHGTDPTSARVFSGHWGWQHHLEAAGWTAVEEDARLEPGTTWAVSAISWPQAPAAGCFMKLSHHSAPSHRWLPRTHTYAIAANIHAHMMSARPPREVYAPFGFGSDPHDTVEVFRAVPCEGQEPGVPTVTIDPVGQP